MAVRPVLIWPDPTLARRAQEVTAFDASVATLVADLFDTMYAEDGVGLAANQVGDLRRVLVLDLDPKKYATKEPEIAEELRATGWRGPLALVNPVIEAASGNIVWEEGCLSVPGITDRVRRKAEIRVAAVDAQGRPQTHTCRGLFAVAVQHEMDHLDGRVFVEYLSPLKRDVIRGKMRNLRQAGHDAARELRQRTPNEL